MNSFNLMAGFTEKELIEYANEKYKERLDIDNIE